MAIIKQYHKDTDTTYVYESTSYWDADKQQSRSKRKLLGKLDPVTGEIIPTGTRGRKKKEVPAEDAGKTDSKVSRDKQNERIMELTAALSEKDRRLTALELENKKLRNTISMLCAKLDSCIDLCASVSER